MGFIFAQFLIPRVSHLQLLSKPIRDLLPKGFGLVPGFRLVFHLAEFFGRYFDIFPEYPRQGTHRACFSEPTNHAFGIAGYL